MGFLLGALVYCATAFPLVFIFGFDGAVWGGICMLWGVLCGGAGVMWGLVRS